MDGKEQIWCLMFSPFCDRYQEYSECPMDGKEQIWCLSYISRSWLQKAAIVLKKILKLIFSLKTHGFNCSRKNILFFTLRKS